MSVWKTLALILAAVLVLTHPAVVLAAGLAALSVLSILITRAARPRVYPCPGDSREAS